MPDDEIYQPLTYAEYVMGITGQISPTLVDFDAPRARAGQPTQASSEFITNREQGDWAEDLVQRAINESDLNYVAVKYGKSEKRVTGEDGFKQYYLDYQDELDTIGKRPDILIFNKKDYQAAWHLDISLMAAADLESIVPLAVAGVEIRSSSFLYDKYNNAQEIELRSRVDRIMQTRELLITEYQDILDLKPGWLQIIGDISPETISIMKINSAGWRANTRLKRASDLISLIRKDIKAYQKRNHLSITPKVEDIKVVTKWIQTYNVPHYYFQVFFDKVFGISFSNILELLVDPANESVRYFLETDVKNQNKTTIKINPQLGFLVAGRVDMATHRSELKELNRGRLLFYVTFDGGYAYLDVESLLANLQLAH